MALRFGWFSFLALAILGAGCTDQSQSGSTSKAQASLSLEGKSPEEVKLIEKGKLVYAAQCTACHNSNPKEPGMIGPAVAGSSAELLRYRVVLGQFPPGYTPKPAPSGGQIHMPPLPFLEPDLPALHAYLNALK